MAERGLRERFAFLTAGFTIAEWFALGAIAVEGELGVGTIEQFVTRPATATSRGKTTRDVIADWLARWRTSGLLQGAGVVRSLSVARAGLQEDAVRVHPEYRQLVLRHLQAEGALEPLGTLARDVLKERSRAGLSLCLQTGNPTELERWIRAMSGYRARREHSIDVLTELRESVCTPFDASWFEATWREAALPIALRILRDALATLQPCAELNGWVQQAVRNSAGPNSAGPNSAGPNSAGPNSASPSSEPEHEPFDDEAEPELSSGLHRLAAQLVSEHAVLSGRSDLILEFAGSLPIETRLGLFAAARYLEGDLNGAQKTLDESLAFAPGGRERGTKASTAGAVESGSVAPLLALLLTSRDSEEARAAAKQLLVSRSNDDEVTRGAGRALRTLFRYATEPDAQYERIDVYQLPATTSAWEFLILGLVVHLYSQREWSRASWSKQMVEKGGQWLEAGYSWMGRQALFLAHALSSEVFEKEFEVVRRDLHLEPLRHRAGELLLRDLVTPKPEWEKALAVLDHLSEEVEWNAEGGVRVAWFVDMLDGTLVRPALQECKQPGGWTDGRRIALGKLYERIDDLPTEDVAVLRRTRDMGGGRREFTSDAVEALIGHPRVYNGARGKVPVEVVRGTCRITTEDVRGYLQIHVDPSGARLGVNTVVESETRLLVVRVTPAMQRVIDVLPHGLRVPKEQEGKALAVLGKLAQGVVVESPHLGQERTVPADATACLRIVPHAGAWLVQAGVRPFGAKGRFFVAGTGRTAISLFSEGQRLRCERSFEHERAQVSLLILECPTLLDALHDEEQVRLVIESKQEWVFGEEALLQLLVELRSVSTPYTVEWPESPAIRVRSTLTSAGIKGTLKRRKGWYLAAGEVSLDEVTELSLSELVNLPFTGNGRFVRLPSGDYLELESRVRRVLGALRLAEPLRRGGKSLRLHPGALQALHALGEEGTGFRVDASAAEWLEQVERVRSQRFALPNTLKATLRPYQVEGFQWLSCLSALGLGACLADDMGLGKTVQILALLLTRVQTGPALVVAPTSVCSNWVNEIHRFAPTLRVQEYIGTDRARVLPKLRTSRRSIDVVICSYTLLQQDASLLCDIPWGTAVLDEAQFIKNPDAKRAQAAFRLIAPCRIAATGTPVENHTGDLWSIFHFLNPGLLGSWKTFHHRFLKPIERERDTSVEEELRRMVQPYILRRLKNQVLRDLPPLTVVQHDVRLSKDEAMRYAVLRKQIHDKLHTGEGKRQNKLEILAQITRLRRFCCHPRLVFPDADQEASKVETFLNLVEELRENQHRALVFSQFVDFLSIVREQLDERRIPYQYLDGSTPPARRKEEVEQFQSGDAPLFLVSLKAGGFGLNLTAADYVIHLDPWWNPAVESQATDRAHRIGQRRPVTVYRLITKDTIEESILELHENKRRIADSLLEGGEKAGKLTVAQLLELIEETPS